MRLFNILYDISSQMLLNVMAPYHHVPFDLATIPTPYCYLLLYLQYTPPMCTPSSINYVDHDVNLAYPSSSHYSTTLASSMMCWLFFLFFISFT